MTCPGQVGQDETAQVAVFVCLFPKNTRPVPKNEKEGGEGGKKSADSGQVGILSYLSLDLSSI